MGGGLMPHLREGHGALSQFARPVRQWIRPGRQERTNGRARSALQTITMRKTGVGPERNRSGPRQYYWLDQLQPLVLPQPSQT